MFFAMTEIKKLIELFLRQKCTTTKRNEVLYLTVTIDNIFKLQMIDDYLNLIYHHCDSQFNNQI